MDRTDNDASNNSSIVKCAFVAAVIFAPSRCLERIEGYIQTHRLMGGFMKYNDEMGSGAMIYKRSFIKIGPTIQKLIRRDTQTAVRSHKPTFISSKLRKWAINRKAHGKQLLSAC
jgi:hypothetical protein